MITWLGGKPCVPSACRSNPSTITIRVKHVHNTRIAGARLSTVSKSTMFNDALNPPSTPGSSTLIGFNSPTSAGATD
jgi:hypothetical protein